MLDIDDSRIKIEVTFRDPKQAGQIYGELLALEMGDNPFAYIYSPFFEIESEDTSGENNTIPTGYTIGMEIHCQSAQVVTSILMLLLNKPAEKEANK